MNARRAACNRCKSMKEGCKPVFDTNGQISTQASACSRCHRLGFTPCLVGNIPWTQHHGITLLDTGMEQLSVPVRTPSRQRTRSASPAFFPLNLHPKQGASLDHAIETAKTMVVPIPINAFNAYVNMTYEVSAQILKLNLTPDAIRWVVTEHFWQAISWMDFNLMYREFLVSNFMSFPWLTGSILLSCFKRDSGELITNETDALNLMAPLHANATELKKLAHILLNHGNSLLALVATAKPNLPPPIPLPVLIELMLASRNMTHQYARYEFARCFVQHNLILQIMATWELHKMDYFDPRRGHGFPSNDYLHQIWESDNNPFPTEIAVWRQMLRRVLWAQMTDEGTYQGSAGGRARLPSQCMAILRPPVPAAFQLLGYDFETNTRYLLAEPDRKWDDWYDMDGLPMPDLTWLYLDRGNLQRTRGLQCALGRIKDNHLSTFLCIAFVVSIGVGEAIYARGDHDGGFFPFKQMPEFPRSRLLTENPLAFWKDLINEIFESFESPIPELLAQSQIQALWALSKEWWGDRLGIRFFIQLLRLIDARLMCRSWTPPLGILPSVQQLWDACTEATWRVLGTNVKVHEIRIPSKYIDFESGKDWFKILRGESMETILTDVIMLSELLNQISTVCSQSKRIRLGQTHSFLTIRNVLIHLSVIVELRRIGDPSALPLIESSLNDIRVHMDFLKLLMGMSSTISRDERPPWFNLLEDKVATDKLDDITIDWVKDFYSSTLVGIE